MKRFIAIFAVMVGMLAVVLPAAAITDFNPSGDTAPGEASTANQQLQTNFPGTIPETRFRGNARIPNQLILGGTQTVQASSNGANPWSNIPSLVLRPFGKSPRDSVDTTITWTTPTAARAYVIPDFGGPGSFLLTASAGVVPASQIQTGSAKRELLRAGTSPAGGAVTVNGTTYFANLAFGRAGIVKAITFMTHVDPVSGTNTIKVLKNGAAGNTMLSTASVSLNGATADVAQPTVLTSTGADLALTATDTVYCEYAAGTQGSVAKDVNVVVEFEPTDF